MQSFSILICTYNPDFAIFNRLLEAILNFENTSPPHEVIIVDNNSQPCLESNPIVKNFLLKKKSSVVIKEKKPGLTAARIAGIRKSKYDWIIFFDDDNEARPDYLLRVEELICKYPRVGSWGPGTIEVEYLSKANAWLQNNKVYFQQRNEAQIKFDLQQEWQSCYPYGTGMIIKKEIAEVYVARVVNNRYTMSDRSGKSLSSGGDVQMVLTGIQLGYSAGVAPELSLKHIIDDKKTDFTYMRKLIYGTTSSYLKSYNQVFENTPIRPASTNNLLVIKLLWYYYIQIRQQKDIKRSILSLTRQLGEINSGLLYDSNLEKPFFLKLFEFFFL